MVRLAGPVVLAELGWMTMGIVDTMMVGRVSAAAMAGVNSGGILFYTVAMVGGGLLLGLDPMIAQAFGAGRIRDCHRSLVSSLYLSLALAPLLMALVTAIPPVMAAVEVKPEILSEARPYVAAINWSLPPLLFYIALRRYLQAMNLVRPVMFALISANLLNAAVNWVLIFGHFGAPALGAAGAGWATTLSRIYMAGVLAAYALYHSHRHRTGLLQTPLAPDGARMGRLVRLGLPAGMQIAFEVAVWGMATTLAGKLDTVAAAAHVVALSAASYTFMVPLGLSAAAAVRVGQAVGRGDAAAAGRAGWTAMALGGGFMLLAGLSFVAAPRWIARVLTDEAEVIGASVTLLALAALFQVFDGLQVVAGGALRGAGDTRTPMLWHLALYWFLGLPLGYGLCFWGGWGAAGLWAGLCVALVLLGVVLLGAWSRKVRRIGFLLGNPGQPPKEEGAACQS